MKKIKRKKIQREWLENQLGKYERRIQRLAEQAYHVRQAISLLDQQEAARNQEKGEMTDAIHQTGIESASGIGTPDRNVGEPELPNNDVVEAVLGEQPTELQND